MADLQQTVYPHKFGDGGCRLSQPVQADSQPRLAWSWVGGRLAPFYIHQNEPGELSQWLCHNDSTINIVLDIIKPQLAIAIETAASRISAVHLFVRPPVRPSVCLSVCRQNAKKRDFLKNCNLELQCVY